MQVKSCCILSGLQSLLFGSLLLGVPRDSEAEKIDKSATDAVQHNTEKLHPLVESLGSYERQALTTALERTGLELYDEPENKVIEKIHIVNLEVFGKDTGKLRYLNRLHRTSSEVSVRNLLLIKEGDLWSEKRARETERIVRSPAQTNAIAALSNVVIVVPVKGAKSGELNALVVTRDIWSLRTNSEFIYQEGRFTSFRIAAAENNFLGTRKHTSLILEMDQGEYSLSSRWRDLQVAGSRWQLTLRPRLIFGRATNNFEGTQSFNRLVYPLWSLASRWGLSFVATHKNSIARNFRGDSVAQYDNPDTEEEERHPEEYRLREFEVESRVTHSLGRRYRHRFSLGHRLQATRPRHLDSTLSPALLEAFERDRFPRNERSSALVVSYDFFEPRFVQFRNVNNFDLPEIWAAGPRFSGNVDLAHAWLGSENRFTRHRFTAGYFLPLPQKSLADLELSLASRQEWSGTEVRSVDQELSGRWNIASPVLLNWGRMVSSGDFRLVRKSELNDRIEIGGQEDLRGFEVGRFSGTSYLRSSLELRSLPHKLGFTRAGYLLFWDMGHAADQVADLQLRHNLGLGARFLIPQIGSSLFFLYWAMPIAAKEKSFPGRLSLGFEKNI